MGRFHACSRVLDRCKNLPLASRLLLRQCELALVHGAQVRRLRKPSADRVAFFSWFHLSQLRWQLVVSPAAISNVGLRGRHQCCLVHGHLVSRESSPSTTSCNDKFLRVRRLAVSAGRPCGLTPPSNGRVKGRCAPLVPPLMSNVRSRLLRCHTRCAGQSPSSFSTVLERPERQQEAVQVSCGQPCDRRQARGVPSATRPLAVGSLPVLWVAALKARLS